MLEKTELRVRLSKNLGCYGLTQFWEDGSIDIHIDMVRKEWTMTVIHECLHAAGFMDEKQVSELELFLFTHLSNRQIGNLINRVFAHAQKRERTHGKGTATLRRLQ